MIKCKVEKRSVMLKKKVWVSQLNMKKKSKLHLLELDKEAKNIQLCWYLYGDINAVRSLLY